MTTSFYSCTLLLLDKTIESPTGVTEGRVIAGDLNPFKGRLELTNTGNSKSNNGVLTLRVPTDGTFVRKAPMLINEESKDKYLIQAQIKQPDGYGGTVNGKLFRFNLGIPTLQDDADSGETIKLQLIAIEYVLKEHLTSKQLKMVNPKKSFEQRILDYNSTRGYLQPALLMDIGNVNPENDSIQLPYDESLKQDYSPFGATKTHDLLKEVIDRLSLPTTSGGTFNDYFFDFDPNEISVNVLNISASKFGGSDTNIIINPLSVNAQETEKDKTIQVDFTEWKNNIIFEGSSNSGTLPMERTKFNSYWQHGQARPEYNVSGNTLYYDGTDKDNPQSLVKITATTIGAKEIIRFFKYVGTNGQTAPSPLASGQTTWHEDFTTIPEYNDKAQYEEGEVVYLISGSTVSFWEVRDNRTHVPTYPIPSAGNADWVSVFNSIPVSRHSPFWSYTPWTSDYYLQKSMISDSVNPYVTASNKWVGIVPDWNLEICNFDRIKSEDQFEQITQKVVIKAVLNSNEISTNEKQNGSRFLIKGTGAGDFLTHNNCVVEWYKPIGTIGIWKFSKTAGANVHELVTALDQGQMWKWNGTAWSVCWSPKADNSMLSSPFHAVFDTVVGETNVKEKMGFGLVVGASGIPAQAIRLKYNWNTITEGKLNLTSRGAWWCMHFPFPRTAITSRTINSVVKDGTIGDTYKNSTFDATNLDINRLGQVGWNRGVDTEDLGRISELTMKVRLSILNSDHILCTGYSDMPMLFWAIDIFGRIWIQNVKLRRNGEYDKIHINFGGNATNIYKNRIDELFGVFGLTLSQNFFLKEKEFTGIEFDWRFVKSFGLGWEIAYDNNRMYVGMRDATIDILSKWASQASNYALRAILGPIIPTEDYVVDNVTIDIDELAFEKQLIVNSDDTHITNARTEIYSEQSEVDYINAKNRAVARRARKKFINQSWHLKAQGDVRMNFGETFSVRGSRIPEQTTNNDQWSSTTDYVIGNKVSYFGTVYQAIQSGKNINPIVSTFNTKYWMDLNSMVCAEVRHIIDSDGYTMDILGVRKFVY